MYSPLIYSPILLFVWQAGNLSLRVSRLQVGGKLSLADVFVACGLPENYKQAINTDKYSHCKRWLEAVQADPNVAPVLGTNLPTIIPQ